MDNVKTYVANKIRKYRKQCGLTQKELGEKIGVKHNTISGYESGTSEPEQDVLFKIANALEISINDLFPPIDLLREHIKGVKPKKQELENESKELKKSPSFDYYEVQSGIAAGCLASVEAIMNCPKMSIADCWLGKYARDKNIVVMHVNGESMNNVIANKSTIAVLTHVDIENIKNGDIVIAEYDTNCECTVKRFYQDEETGNIILRPDSSNLSFHDIVIKYENIDKLVIYGKVVVYNVVM